MSLNTRIAAGLAALAIALGAFGAHGLEERFAAVGEKAMGWWETATFYHLTHAIALFALGLAGVPAAWPRRLMIAGIVLFSGSLYVMAVTGVTKLGMVTPLGGVAFIAGWAMLAFGRSSE